MLHVFSMGGVYPDPNETLVDGETAQSEVDEQRRYHCDECGESESLRRNEPVTVYHERDPA